MFPFNRSATEPLVSSFGERYRRFIFKARLVGIAVSAVVASFGYTHVNGFDADLKAAEAHANQAACEAGFQAGIASIDQEAFDSFVAIKRNVQRGKAEMARAAKASKPATYTGSVFAALEPKRR